jgi:CheY-like chemotaxis protein
VCNGRPPLNILLVEDDELDVMNVQRAFKKNNVVNPLHTAGNGIEALEMLRGDAMPKDRRLILLDLNMPRMGRASSSSRSCAPTPTSGHTPSSCSRPATRSATRSRRTT